MILTVPTRCGGFCPGACAGAQSVAVGVEVRMCCAWAASVESFGTTGDRPPAGGIRAATEITEQETLSSMSVRFLALRLGYV